MFLSDGGDKEFVVKSYVDESFYTGPDESKSQSGYILKVGTISWSSSVQSIFDIDIYKILTELNITDPLTKIISQAKHDHTLVLFGC